MKTLGEKLKALRKEKAMSHLQLANMLCTTQSTVGKYERGELQTSLETLKLICEILDVSADYLLGLED